MGQKTTKKSLFLHMSSRQILDVTHDTPKKLFHMFLSGRSPIHTHNHRHTHTPKQSRKTTSTTLCTLLETPQQEPPRFTCTHPDCIGKNKSYSFNKNLNLHIKDVHEPKTFKCSACLKPFARRHTLDRHFRVTHEKRERKFACKKCDRKFQEKSQLKTHVDKVHKGVFTVNFEKVGKKMGGVTRREFV